MKRLFLFLLALASLTTSFAQLDGTGYYRVKNYGSGRYIYVCDGTSSGINVSTTSADMGAIQTWTGLDKAITDPASVIYAKNVGGDNWDLMAQGTGVHQLINYYVGVTELSHDSNIYQVSATASGMTMYLYDNEISNSERGRLGTGSTSSTSVPAKYNRWQVYGIDPTTDNYVAVAPSLNVNGKYYAPYYASYPFTFYSSGMKAYYVTKIDKTNKAVVIKQLDGIIPSATPVIIESGTSAVASNKLKLEDYESYNNRPADNKLSGVYFSNPYRESPVAYKLYDKATMRVLGKTSAGKLGFVTATNDMLHNCGDSDGALWCLNANQAYLTVESGTAEELTVVTEEEYEETYNKKVTSVTLNQTSLSLQVGQTSTLTATIAPSNASNKNLTWSSSNETVATVSNGVVTAKAVGTATIYAKTNDGSNITASCQVTVTPVVVTSVTLNTTSAELKEGETLQLTATVKPDNAANKTLTWKSSNTAVATVDTNGKVTAVKAGNADITATTTDGTNLSAKCSIKVNAIVVQSITLDKTSIEDVHGKQVQLTATVLPANASNKDVTWTTSNANVATVNNGLVTLIAVGNATITVTTTDDTNLSATCSVKVDPILVTSISLNTTTEEVKLGESVELTASILPENADNKKVTWKSSDTNIASVDEYGKVTTKNTGKAVITATTTDGTNLSATCDITVVPILVESITLNPTVIDAHVGDMIQLVATVLPENATNKSVSWSIDNSNVASVTDNGLVTILSEGEAKITVATTDGSRLAARCKITSNPLLATSISVNPTSVTMEEGQSEQLSYTILPENVTSKDVIWTSGDEEVVKVSASGLITGIKQGKAEVAVHTTDGSELSATCEVVVNIRSAIASVKASDFPEGTKYYTISGQSLPGPRKGLIIVKYANGKTAKVNVK